MLNRRSLIRLVNAALHAKRPDHARSLARAWLQLWPNDVRIQYALARAYAAEERVDAALGILTDLVDLDPEHAGAQRLIGNLARQKGMSELAQLAAAVADVLEGGHTLQQTWLQHLSRGRAALASGAYETALEEAGKVILAQRPTPLPSLLLVQAHWLAGEHDLAQPLAQGFAERWPKCIALALCLADCLLHAGDHARAVQWLHTVAGLDPAGEVVRRYWGAEHPYTALWPPEPSMPLPGPVAPEVSAVLGFNQLGPAPDPGETVVAKQKPPRRAGTQVKRPLRRPRPKSASQQPAAPETLRDIEAQLERVASQLSPKPSGFRLRARRQSPVPRRRRSPVPGRRRSPVPRRRRPNTRHHRRPVHVILTSKRNLTAKYGPEAFARLAPILEELAQAVRQYARRPALVVMPDEFDSLRDLGLDPIDQNNPWQVKLLLHDLNHRLARKGQTIGSLLIVGGDDIVPFHRLPNPTDDVDPDVPSDNPYGALDENYFVPDWPVGRLPAPCSPDPAPLIASLRNAIGAHRSPPQRLRFPFNLVRLLVPHWQPGVDPRRSFGYTADVWEKASRNVYDVIGHPRDLATSPPAISTQLPGRVFAPLDLSYFNLHGLEDTAEWYGQRAGEDGDAPLYPLALCPADIPNNGRAPRIVVTEACYGAHILDKQSTTEALCLRFLEAGSLAVIGSTRLSYGSVASPLIAADLLGSYFWETLLTGAPVGEALRIAKLEFGQEMQRRQGFLDGEDQKTLISFVLYGDPLLQAPRTLPHANDRTNGSKSVPRRTQKSIGRAVCTKGEFAEISLQGAGSEEYAQTLAKVKALAARYLPDLEGCAVNAHRTHVACDGEDHECLASQLPTAKAVGRDPQQVVFTLGNSLPLDGHISHHYARVTVDRRGSVVKMAVTR